MSSEAWDWVIGAGLVALVVLNVVGWSMDRSRVASWNDSLLDPSDPPPSRASRGVRVSQSLVMAALGAIVLLRFFDVLP